MYRCVNCGAVVEQLYGRLYINVLKLLKCDACDQLADKYIEYDPVIILVDLILLEKRAYRHLLYNCDLKSCWKLVIIIWLVESFRNLSLCDNKKNTETSRIFQPTFDGYCNLYLILFKTAFSLAAFVVVVILFTKIKWFFYPKDPNKYSITHVWKALIIGGSCKLLGLLEITWGHIFLAPHYFLILGYTLLCLLTAYSVVTSSGKLESSIVLGIGILVYNCASNFLPTIFESLQLI
ncbi:ACAT-related protein required for viability 1 [Ptiloglossa arizonensis]|uniref:ACAT-related protein required for viability 1 n=1 Tax=Ptiloglossa arizonensis TaxID=3350558 RepID=UPI003FA014D3